MDLRAELETAHTPPEAAMRAAVGEAPTLAPAVIEVVTKAAEGAYLLPAQDRLLFYGLHVLGAARCAALYRPFMRLLRRPEAELDRRLGDAVTETVPRIALSVYDGDPDPLIAVIEDRAAVGTVRWGLFHVLARLTFDGAIPRETARGVIERFDRERLAANGDAAWEGWQDAVILLGLDDLAERVRAAWADGRSPQRDVDKEDWEQRLRDACADPAERGRFDFCALEPIDDPAEALAWVGPADMAEPAGAPDKLLGDDPAAGIALNEDEIEWLAGFLGSAQVPETTMSLAELDGFVAALVVGPDTVLPSEYLPEIWGTPDGEGPVFESDEQIQFVFALLMRHWNTIATRLADGYPHVPPLLWGAEEASWARGFLRGMALRADSWRPLIDDEQARPLLAPLAWLADPDSALDENDDAADFLTQTMEILTLAPIGLYHYWHAREAGARGATPRRVRKIGRNEPCPCGSGRKYKKCCGSPAASTRP